MNESMTQFRTEGSPAFPMPDKGTETPSDSSTETTEEKEPQTPAGDGNKQEDPDKDKPFHQHPRWLEREKEWKERFNSLESKHQEEIRKLRDEFGPRKEAEAEYPPIPTWFGGDEEQWKAYYDYEQKKLERAADLAEERRSKKAQEEEKAIKEATEYMWSEIEKIKSDPKLNPAGSDIDHNRLLRIAMDNDLVTSNGHWNYRAAYKLLQQEAPAKPDTKAKQALGAATTAKESKTEEKKSSFKTPADFKKNRPW